MQTPNIRVLFVDVGNVCLAIDFHRFITSFSRTIKIPEAQVEAVLCANGPGSGGYSPLFESFECGEIGPVGFFIALTNTLKCADRIDFNTFARLWVDVFEKENTELDELLHRIPQEKYLLSNINTLMHGRCVAYCTIVRNHFPTRDRRILSYDKDVHAIKPNPLIYKVALARAKVRPEETLFIDDMPENIAVWQALGGHGIVYHVKKNSIQELETALRTFGVLV